MDEFRSIQAMYLSQSTGVQSHDRLEDLYKKVVYKTKIQYELMDAEDSAMLEKDGFESDDLTKPNSTSANNKEVKSVLRSL